MLCGPPPILPPTAPLLWSTSPSREASGPRGVSVHHTVRGGLTAHALLQDQEPTGAAPASDRRGSVEKWALLGQRPPILVPFSSPCPSGMLESDLRLGAPSQPLFPSGPA